MGAAISIADVAKTFGTHRAVDGLGFEVAEGSIFGLLGRNGAGKSTTIRMILDIIRPDSGSIRIFGEPISDAIKDRIGYLPEERGLYPKMKVLDLLQFQGSVKGLGLAEAKKLAADWLDRLELGAWKEKKVEELSKGMQQKVQLVAAILHRPDLLILDEPFSGMDPVNQELFRELISELNRDGATVVFSTHVMASAEELCRSIVLIDRGKAKLAGSLAEIRERYGTNTVHLEFDGDGSFLSLLPGVASAEERADRWEVTLAEGASARDLLRKVVERLDVRRFEIVRPSLHNIFIQEVGTSAGRDSGSDAKPEALHA